jgi:PhoPQ-activated pathogenicity-related protein
MVGPNTRTPEFSRLADIVDPYSYLSTKRGAPSPWPAPHFESVPKLVVDGGNDEFFLPDDNHICELQLVAKALMLLLQV